MHLERVGYNSNLHGLRVKASLVQLWSFESILTEGEEYTRAS